MKLLVVEDEAQISSFLLKGLRRRGFTVEHVHTGREALEHASRADLVLLDLGLPDLDGLEVLRRLRRNGESVPVLVLTARGEVADRVKGLNFGADDYLTKPFAFEELVARVRALLRRGMGEERVDHEVEPVPTAAARRVLLVEDESRIAQFLARGLAPLGIEVTVSEDADVATFLALTDRFDLVILDLTLPDRSGLDVLRALRADWPALPVIVLTASDDPHTRAAALEAGATEYVTKPFVFEELETRVRRYLDAA